MKHNFGAIALNIYLACLMGWMLVMVIVAVGQLIQRHFF